MDFRIADTFTASLMRLTGAEQKAVKTTAFDLQLDPSAPGMSFHKLDRARDPNFWSVRVNADIRLIVHKSASSLLLCFVAHHDDAYGWAARRRIERHPATGAAQLVEIPERIGGLAQDDFPPFETEEVPQPRFLPPLFLSLSDDDLLGVGVPPDWVKAVRNATDNNFFDLADHLPAEAVEALLDYVGTGNLRPAVTAAAGADPFDHPDARRRFRVLDNVEELARALDFPWEKWTVFLHPAQRQVVERAYGGPARVSGSAGTGKTIVALHRAVFLARRHGQARVLLTTFSPALAGALKVKLGRLAGNEPYIADRITVQSVTGIGAELYTNAFGPPAIASADVVRSLLAEQDQRFSPRFLFGEWSEVVDAWQLRTWEDYRDVARLGRKTRIGGRQRQDLWAIFAQVRAALAERGLITWAELFAAVSGKPAFDFVVVDEAQDVGIAEMRFLAGLAGDRPDGLFFAGDLGQRIFQQPFSWKALGVDVRGRSHNLRINYRTSHQIRLQADRLLPGTLSDVDGNAESRKGTVSLFNGPAPRIETFADKDLEAKVVAGWLMDLVEDGMQPEEIGLIVRAEPQLARARAALEIAGIPAVDLNDSVEATAGRISIGTMHTAKGLEFRAVAVMACDDEIVPLQERIETVADDADLEEVYTTERHLLYVACTRARDHLLVTGVEPASEFLGDLTDGA